MEHLFGAQFDLYFGAKRADVQICQTRVTYINELYIV